MEPLHWALLVKPFIALVLIGVCVIPLIMLLDRIWPNGPVKRFLFKKRG